VDARAFRVMLNEAPNCATHIMGALARRSLSKTI
jgi:hypothetical protein